MDLPFIVRDIENVLSWTFPTAQARRTFGDLVFATERGASAVAISIVEVEFGLVVVARSRRPSGFDYWVGYERGNLFQDSASAKVSI
jgi:hypothetical protein